MLHAVGGAERTQRVNPLGIAADGHCQRSHVSRNVEDYRLGNSQLIERYIANQKLLRVRICLITFRSEYCDGRQKDYAAELNQRGTHSAFGHDYDGRADWAYSVQLRVSQLACNLCGSIPPQLAALSKLRIRKLSFPHALSGGSTELTTGGFGAGPRLKHSGVTPLRQISSLSSECGR